MYIYNIYQDEDYFLDFYLAHEKRFSQEEFNIMCESAPKIYDGGYSISYIFDHLIDTYGFKNINDFVLADFEARRNINQKIKDNDIPKEEKEVVKQQILSNTLLSKWNDFKYKWWKIWN